jgi:hypothetical protein
MGPANVAPWLEQVGDGLAKKVTIGLDAEISEVAVLAGSWRLARQGQLG